MVPVLPCSPGDRFRHRSTLDSTGDGNFDAGDQVLHFGLATDQFFSGDWNNSGKAKLGVARPDADGTLAFFLDLAGDGNFDPASDSVFHYGHAGDQVIAGRWRA